MIVLAVDPGTTHSAYVTYDTDTQEVCDHEVHALNQHLSMFISALHPMVDWVVFEKIESMGMAVGVETFETVFWTGVLYQVASAAGARVDRLPRRAVKIHLCGSMKAKDANIRQALIDRFGGSTAIGKKATPGPLYGLRSHEFQALGVAITWAETHEKNGEKS